MYVLDVIFINVQEHGFGHKQQSSSHLLTSLNDDLVESVGMLETLILIYLVDLPSLTSSSSQSGAKLPLGDAREAAKVDRLVAGLGSCAEHGPVMLAWMLARSGKRYPVFTCHEASRLDSQYATSYCCS